MRRKNLQEEELDVRPGKGFGLFILLGSVTTLVFVFRQRIAQAWRSLALKLPDILGRRTLLTREKLKNLDIEIRYETEKDADATLLAENVVKVIRIVLLPLAKKIRKEEAKVIFVFNGDSWEIRMRNASEKLRQAVRTLLEAKEW